MLVDPKLIEFCRQIHLGVKIAPAGRLCGIKNPHRMLKRPEVKAFMLQLQKEARDEFDFTRREVVQGLKEAIEQARILEEPMAQIAGWREIAKVLGHYEPETKRIILSTEEENRKRQLGMMDEKLLLEMAGSQFIDAEFDLIGVENLDEDAA
jgi:hypothetical protein